MKKVLVFTINILALLAGYAQHTEGGNYIMSRWAYLQNTHQILPDINEQDSFKIIINAYNELRLKKVESDELGYTHYTFNQFHKGIPVEDAIYKIHTYDNQIVSSNGTVYSFLDLDTGNISAINQPLVVAIKNDLHPLTDSNLIFAYIQNSGDTALFYFDACTGLFFKERNLIDYVGENVQMMGNTLYNGQRELLVRRDRLGIIGRHYFFLLDKTRSDKIMALTDTHYLSYHSYEIINDDDIIHVRDTSDFNIGVYRDAISAYWAMEKSYDYFKYTFGRNSYDNNNGRIVLLPWITNYQTSFWSSSQKVFGFVSNVANTSGAMVSLDVVGHEYTHAIISSTSDLLGINEPGALNESFGDIFGTMIEFYVLGNLGNYYIGEDFFIPDGKLRDMMNPKTKQHPNTYHGTYWSDEQDTCKTHVNCGVQNYWFYLLSEGGSGTNDNGVDYVVNGIGKNKAAQIAYRSMVYYLTPTANYSDAKNGSIMAAIDLFGIHSNEVLQTILAWDAVGVSSTNGIYYYIDMSDECEYYTQQHNALIPLSVSSIGYLYSNCSFSSNNTPIVFAAGKTIVLTDGFCSGDNFTATTISSVIPKNVQQYNSEYTEWSINNPNTEMGNGIIKSPLSVRIYPNPVHHSLTIDASKELKYVIILDINGRIMYETELQGIKTTISSLSWKPGIYLMKVIALSGEVSNTKIVKK